MSSRLDPFLGREDREPSGSNGKAGMDLHSSALSKEFARSFQFLFSAFDSLTSYHSCGPGFAVSDHTMRGWGMVGFLSQTILIDGFLTFHSNLLTSTLLSIM